MLIHYRKKDYMYDENMWPASLALFVNVSTHYIETEIA